MVPGEGSGLQQHVCCNCGEHSIINWKVCSVRFIFSVLHVDDEFINAGVAVPHFVEDENEFYAGGAVESSTEFGKMIKEISWRDGGEEGVWVTQLLNKGCFDVGDDEVARADFHCMYPVFGCLSPPFIRVPCRASLVCGRLSRVL